MSDLFAKMLPKSSCVWVVLWVLLLLRVCARMLWFPFLTRAKFIPLKLIIFTKRICSTKLIGLKFPPMSH